jgi:hypothetical protein
VALFAECEAATAAMLRTSTALTRASPMGATKYPSAAIIGWNARDPGNIGWDGEM